MVLFRAAAADSYGLIHAGSCGFVLEDAVAHKLPQGIR